MKMSSVLYGVLLLCLAAYVSAQGCFDDDPLCRTIGPDVCKPPLTEFGKSHCGVFCEFCTKIENDTMTNTTTSSPTDICPEDDPSCRVLGDKVCNPPLEDFGRRKCSRFCEFCFGPTSTTEPTTTTTTEATTTTTEATTTTAEPTTTTAAPTTAAPTKAPTTTTEEPTTTAPVETPPAPSTVKPGPTPTTPAPTPAPTTTAEQFTGHPIFSDCNKTAEVVFVLDSSSSVGRENFLQMVDYTENVTKSLKTEYERLNVTVIKYSNEAEVALKLNESVSLTDMINAESTIHYGHGGTATHKALQLMTQQFNPLVNNPKIAVVITDGSSFNPTLTALEANAAKKNGVAVFVIGVGEDVNPQELKVISSDPDDKFLFQLTDFFSLNLIVNLFHPKQCTELLTTTTEEPTTTTAATTTTTQPPTPAPTTAAPTTTTQPPTPAPTTAAPTTTTQPPTPAPTTAAPTTTTQPATPAPTTAAPTTTTQPATPAPTTAAPTTTTQPPTPAPTTAAPTTTEAQTPEPSTAAPTTTEAKTPEPSTAAPTTTEAQTPEPPKTTEAQTPEPSTAAPTTTEAQTPEPPKTTEAQTPEPSTAAPTTTEAQTPEPPKTTEAQTPEPSTAAPTTTVAQTPEPSTAAPTTTEAQTPAPSTAAPTTTTQPPTPAPTTAAPTTTTTQPPTPAPTTAAPTTTEAKTPEPSTAAPTTTVAQTPEPPTAAPTTTTEPPTPAPSTAAPITTEAKTPEPSTAAPTTTEAQTPEPPTAAPTTTTEVPTPAPSTAAQTTTEAKTPEPSTAAPTTTVAQTPEPPTAAPTTTTEVPTPYIVTQTTIAVPTPAPTTTTEAQTPAPTTEAQTTTTAPPTPAPTQEATTTTTTEAPTTAVPITSTLPQVTTTASCIAKIADVVFVVDASGSIGVDNFQKIKQFIKDVINWFDVGPTYTRVGLIRYSSTVKFEFKLNNLTTGAEMLQAVDQISYSGGGTSTSDALRVLRSEGFEGERPDAPDIAIVITDGLSKYPLITRTQAELAKKEGITMFSIGIGNLTDTNELLAIASDKQYLTQVGDYDTLLKLDSVIAHKACGVVLPEGGHYTRSTTTMTTPATECADVSPDCASYPRDSCTDFEPYARKNCARTCGYCPGFPIVEPPCEDKLDNCGSYSSDMCYSPTQYEWVDANCRKFCGFCGNKTEITKPTPPPTTTVAAVAECKNKLENCGSYNSDICTNPSYKFWARDNCAKFCYFCYNYHIVPSQTVHKQECPEWVLPEECKLEYNDDSCCPFPVCQPGFRLSVQRE